MNTIINHNIEFVSYTGRFPNLCTGDLTLRIDGEEVVFDGKQNPRFWTSGGRCYMTHEDYGDYVYRDKWELIDVEHLEDLDPKYIDMLDDMLDVMNTSNVQYGCCGGCL